MALKRPFSDLDWLQTPEMVRHYILYLERSLNDMQKQVESHEKRNRNKGGQKGHEPHQQQILEPTESHWLMPERCICGHSAFDRKQMQPFYVHQHIELPKINMDISHFILHQCDCPNCGKTIKAKLPADKATGYGPRFTAIIGELSGIKAMSRNDVKQLCESVLQIPIGK